VPPRLSLIVLGHGAILLPLWRSAKAKCHSLAPECHLAIACKDLWRDAFPNAKQ